MSTLVEKLQQIKSEKLEISSAFEYANQAGILTGDVSAIAFADYSDTVSNIVSVAVDAADKYNALSGEYEQLSNDYDELSAGYSALSTENANALSIADQILS